MEEYIRLGWPEYQDYVDIEGFEDNSDFSVDNNCYYTEKKWLLDNTNIFKQ